MTLNSVIVIKLNGISGNLALFYCDYANRAVFNLANGGKEDNFWEENVNGMKENWFVMQGLQFTTEFVRQTKFLITSDHHSSKFLALFRDLKAAKCFTDKK